MAAAVPDVKEGLLRLGPMKEDKISKKPEGPKNAAFGKNDVSPPCGVF